MDKIYETARSEALEKDKTQVETEREAALKNPLRALAGMAKWIESRPEKLEVMGSNPSRAHAWVSG